MAQAHIDLKAGQRYSGRFSVDESVVQRFSTFSGDDNPIHLDRRVARRFGFRDRPSHGAILLAELSRIIGTELPGHGSLWLSSSIEFKAPVHPGDEVEFEVEVAHVSTALDIVVLEIVASRDNGHVTVLEGTANVKILKETMALSYLPLDQQTILVTGGTKGLGRSISESLLDAGGRVVALYKSDEEKAESFAGEMKAHGDRFLPLRCDVADSSAIDKLFRDVENRSLTVTSLVHAASPAIRDVPLADLSWKMMESFLATYVKGGLELVQRLLPSFQESGAGRVVLIGSEAVQAPRKHWVHYVTAKSAYLGLIRALSVELAEFGTTANLVSPGLLHTSDALPGNVKDLTRNATPLKRLASEDEVAEVVLFLLEKGGSFMSGANIPLSGARVFA